MKLFVTRILFALLLVASLSTATILVSTNTARATIGSVLVAQSGTTTTGKTDTTKDAKSSTSSSVGGLVPCGNDPAKPCTVKDFFILIARLTNYLVTAAGVFAIIFLVIAGVSMVTAVGNEQQLAAAKNRLTYAVMGLVLVLTAYIIVRFFLYNVLGLQGPSVLENSPADFINSSGAPANTTKTK